ncbi:MAG TPA: hypothetical protein VFF64_20905 [Candidatus Eremiobacteraceae bacterium]|nr:hypothetical protein [Candidatus Eremiobacteraceae bacterium]
MNQITIFDHPQYGKFCPGFFYRDTKLPVDGVCTSKVVSKKTGTYNGTDILVAIRGKLPHEILDMKIDGSLRNRQG